MPEHHHTGSQLPRAACALALLSLLASCGGGGGGADGTTAPPVASAARAELPSATVLLRWDAPAQREDGSGLAISEIAGYQICYVGSDGRIVLLPEGDELLDVTSYIIEDLPADHYQFNVFTIDSDGLISAPSQTIIIGLDQFAGI